MGLDSTPSVGGDVSLPNEPLPKSNKPKLSAIEGKTDLLKTTISKNIPDKKLEGLEMKVEELDVKADKITKGIAEQGSKILGNQPQESKSPLEEGEIEEIVEIVDEGIEEIEEIEELPGESSPEKEIRDL